jgi:O-succinylbenzoate synthase
MLRIERITLREIRLRLREPFRISSGVVDERRILLLELRDASGITEWSECVAGELPNYSPETVDTAWLAIREWLAPRILGKGIGVPPEGVYDILERHVSGHYMAKAALEMGCWGIAARLRQSSLAKLLGGERDKVATGISIGIQRDPDALVQRALAAHKEGYRKIKLKIQPGADVEFVRAVRQAMPNGVSLSCDANSAYVFGDAQHLAQLDEFGLLMIEQPLHRDDLVRHAALQHQAGARGWPGDVQAHPRFLRQERHPGMVRRNAGERHRPRVQRGAGIAAELPVAGRPVAKRALLGERHRRARVDDGRRRHGDRTAGRNWYRRAG